MMAFVLAGGLGTRLRPRFGDLPQHGAPCACVGQKSSADRRVCGVDCCLSASQQRAVRIGLDSRRNQAPCLVRLIQSLVAHREQAVC